MRVPLQVSPRLEVGTRVQIGKLNSKHRGYSNKCGKIFNVYTDDTADVSLDCGKIFNLELSTLSFTSTVRCVWCMRSLPKDQLVKTPWWGEESKVCEKCWTEDLAKFEVQTNGRKKRKPLTKRIKGSK